MKNSDTESIKINNILYEYFHKEINILYLFGSICMIIGQIIDIPFADHTILIVTIISVAIILGCLLLKIFDVIKIQTSYLIMTFVTFASFYFLYYHNIVNNISITILVMRDIVVYPLFLISLGFIAGKKSVLYLGISLTVIFIIVALASQESALIENSIFIAIMLIITIMGFLFFLRSMEKALLENKKQKVLIKSRNIEFEQLNDELQKSNSDLNKLISIIGHDLRGPIGNIGNLLSLLKDDSLEKEEYNEIFKALEGTANASYNLLINLLTWARTEKGELQCEPQKVNLCSIVDEVIELSQYGSAIKSIEILNQTEAELNVNCDIEMIKAILRNLVSNSIKFTKDGGTINIYNKLKGNMVIVTVKDNGVGLCPEKVAKILSEEKFESTLGTNCEVGTGIGLELCKRFVRQNKGDFWVESEINVGTQFHFSLPVWE